MKPARISQASSAIYLSWLLLAARIVSGGESYNPVRGLLLVMELKWVPATAGVLVSSGANCQAAVVACASVRLPGKHLH